MIEFKLQIHTGAWDGSAEYIHREGEAGIRCVDAVIDGKRLFTCCSQIRKVSDNPLRKFAFNLEDSLKTEVVQNTSFKIFPDDQQEPYEISLNVDFSFSLIEIRFNIDNGTVSLVSGKGVRIHQKESGNKERPTQALSADLSRLISNEQHSKNNTKMTYGDVSAVLSKIEIQNLKFREFAQNFITEMDTTFKSQLAVMSLIKKEMEEIVAKVDMDRVTPRLQDRISEDLEKILPAIDLKLAKYQEKNIEYHDAIDNILLSQNNTTSVVNGLIEDIKNFNENIGGMRNHVHGLTETFKKQSEQLEILSRDLIEHIEKLDASVNVENNLKEIPIIPQIDRDIHGTIEKLMRAIIAELPVRKQYPDESEAPMSGTIHEFTIFLDRIKNKVRQKIDDWQREMTSEPAVLVPVTKPLQMFLEADFNNDVIESQNNTISIPTWSDFIDSRIRSWASSRSFSLIRAFRNYLEAVDQAVTGNICRFAGEGKTFEVDQIAENYSMQLEDMISKYIIVAIRASDFLIGDRSSLDDDDKRKLLKGIDEIIEVSKLEEIVVLSKPKFDSSLHEPIEENTSDDPVGTVIDFHSRGFKYNGRVLNKAEVILSKGRQEA